MTGRNLPVMKLKAVVQYLGKAAFYTIYPEGRGIYNARLESYDGPDAITPPEQVLLVKGPRRWTGCTEEQLIADLGQAIEEELNKQDVLFPAREAARTFSSI